MNWLVGYVRGKQEFEFQRNMFTKYGIAVYVPVGKKRVKLRKIKKWIAVKFPAFPNYVFIDYDRDIPWSALNSDPSFGYCVGTEDGPVHVDNRVVEAIRQAEDRGVFDRDQFDLFAPQARVRITNGPLKGRTGTVERLVNGQTGRMVVELDGKIAKINLDFLEIIPN